MTSEIDASNVTASGAVSVLASTTGSIFSVAIAGTLAASNARQTTFQFSGAGAVTLNTVSGTIVAEINQGQVTSQGLGGLTISATDSSQITADAGGMSLSFLDTGGSSANIAVGAGVAVNGISRTIEASSSGAALDATSGPVSITAASTSSITTWAVGIAGTISGGGGGGAAFAGAGSGAGASVTNNIWATLTGGTVVSAGSLTVSATDAAQINTQAGGLAIALARGPPTAIAIGASIASNSIGDSVEAEITNASSVSASTLALSATENSGIDAWTVAGGVSVADSGSGSGLSLSGAGTASMNSISNTVLAEVSGVTTLTLTDATHAAVISSTDSAQVGAVAGAAAFGIRFSSGSGANVAVGAAAAADTINDSSKALISSVPTFTTPGDLDQSATESATIQAITVGIAGGDVRRQRRRPCPRGRWLRLR